MPESDVIDFRPLDADFLRDPYPIFAAPVFFAADIGMWVVTRYADVEAIFRDHRRFSATVAMEPLCPVAPEAIAVLRGGMTAQPTMANCDPPVHSRIRRQNLTAFSGRRIAVLEPAVTALAQSLVESLATQPPPVDFVAAVSFPLATRVIFDLVGYPEQDTDLLKTWLVPVVPGP